MIPTLTFLLLRTPAVPVLGSSNMKYWPSALHSSKSLNRSFVYLLFTTLPNIPPAILSCEDWPVSRYWNSFICLLFTLKLPCILLYLASSTLEVPEHRPPLLSLKKASPWSYLYFVWIFFLYNFLLNFFLVSWSTTTLSTFPNWNTDNLSLLYNVNRNRPEFVSLYHESGGNLWQLNAGGTTGSEEFTEKSPAKELLKTLLGRLYWDNVFSLIFKLVRLKDAIQNDKNHMMSYACKTKYQYSK